MCNGHVDARTQVVLRGSGPNVVTNRLLPCDYPNLFKEHFAGSEQITKAMRHALKTKVAVAGDICKGKEHDLLDKNVYQRMKSSVKARDTMYEHFAPPCTDFNVARRPAVRSKEYPRGLVQTDHILDNTTLALRSLSFCELRHHPGNYFIFEYPKGSLVTEFKQFKSLRETPGVYVLSFDNGAKGYDEECKKITMLLTNCSWLHPLAKDCPGVAEVHRHTPLRFEDIPPSKVSSYSYTIGSK
jgi:hypothetical protein